jgi:hypothetical protein
MFPSSQERILTSTSELRSQGRSEADRFSSVVRRMQKLQDKLSASEARRLRFSMF